ncbi:MAG TPA: protein kinase [Candidatus Eisenbacteria bacterium]|nr:protein kinase [Candidatus Eisenbacteria bacterium]
MEGGRILHYRVVGRLGQGGMGEVVLAEDERLGRRVALKFLSRSFAADPQARERLQREARSLAALSHPHIATIHALEESAERLFLVMEYVEGETLAQAIARRPLPVEHALSVGLAMAEALAHAHARGVVHRDVKPANILIRPDGSAVLTDFGIADLESATRLTAEGYTPGTVAYMSPEQARGARVDARSDLFSLGAVLYEALTGARPFVGDRPESALYAVQHVDPEPPTAKRAGIPVELDRIVMKCLRKDPALRYQHGDDLAADLMALRSPTAGMEATATIAAPSRPRGGRRVRRIATLAVAALLALALVYLAGRPGSDEHGTAVAAEKSIAVLSFQNLAEAGDPSGSGPIATSLLSVGLGQMQVMPVVSAQRIHDVLRQMGKAGTVVQGADALEVARKAGASHVVTGFIYSVRPELVLGAEVASTADGKVLTAARVRTPAGESALFAAVDSLTRTLLGELARAGFQVQEERVDVASLTTRDPVAYRAYVRGLDKLYLGSTEEAVLEFQRAVAADSTFALAWYYAAIANWWSNEFTTAEEEVRAALRVGGRLTPRERDGLGALDALVRGRYREAAERYRTLLTRYPDDREFAYGLGEALYHDSRDESARAAFEQAVRLDPSFGIAYIHLVDLDVARDDFDGALKVLEGLRQANPDDPGYHMLRGRVLAERGDAAGAIATYRDALALEPRLGEAWLEIVRIHSTSGQFDSARIVLGRMESDRGDHDPTLVDSKFIYLASSGRYGAVLELMETLPESLSSPGMRTPPVRLFYREALRERGQMDAVLRDSRRHMNSPIPTRSFGRGHLHDDMAEIHIRMGQVDKAERLLAEYDRMIGKEPTGVERGNRDYVAGLVALARGRTRDAIPLLERSKPMGPPGRLEAQRSGALASAYLALGDTARAVTELQLTVTRSLRNLDIAELSRLINRLAALQERQGRREEALRLYRRVEFQYREADPGVEVLEEARAGIRRLTRPA